MEFCQGHRHDFFFFLSRHTRYHYISSWDNCSLSKVCYFPGGNPLPDCGFSMFNINRYNPKATNCVIDNVLITIHKRYKTAKTRKLSAWSGIYMFKKTHRGGGSSMKRIYFFLLVLKILTQIWDCFKRNNNINRNDCPWQHNKWN